MCKAVSRTFDPDNTCKKDVFITFQPAHKTMCKPVYLERLSQLIHVMSKAIHLER